MATVELTPALLQELNWKLSTPVQTSFGQAAFDDSDGSRLVLKRSMYHSLVGVAILLVFGPWGGLLVVTMLMKLITDGAGRAGAVKELSVLGLGIVLMWVALLGLFKLVAISQIKIDGEHQRIRIGRLGGLLGRWHEAHQLDMVRFDLSLARPPVVGYDLEITDRDGAPLGLKCQGTMDEPSAGAVRHPGMVVRHGPVAAATRAGR